MVHGYKVFLHIRSVFEWSQSENLIVASNPDIRSARLYGQFSLDKMWTLQAGSSVRESERGTGSLNNFWTRNKNCDRFQVRRIIL